MQHNSHSAYPVSLGDDLRRQYALAGVAPEAGAQRIVAIDAASTSARIAPHVNVCQSRQSRQRPINVSENFADDSVDQTGSGNYQDLALRCADEGTTMNTNFQHFLILLRLGLQLQVDDFVLYKARIDEEARYVNGIDYAGLFLGNSFL